MMKVHDVQSAALAASENKRGFGYFMEQGLGKTYTALLDFQRHLEGGLASRMVVLAPNSFKGGWVDEMEKWGFEFDAHVFESGSSSNKTWATKKYKAPPVLIINYEAIRSDATFGYVVDFIRGAVSGAFGVADESVQLKGHDSLQTVAAIQLGKYLSQARILTGKPVVQGPMDLWGQMRFLGHMENKNFYAFKTAFCRMGGFKNKQVIGAQNEEILAEIIEPWVFRATKADWTDLPPKVHSVREYKLSPELRAMYKSMEDDFVLWMESGEVVTVDAAITKYIKLAQIQAGFIIHEDGRTEELVPPAKNPRVQLLKEVIEASPGKVTIPYKHRYVLELLRGQLADLQPAYIGGGMSPDEVRTEKERFTNDNNCRAILLQHTAAKYGHTLLGGPEPWNRCSTNIFFENTYSGDDRSQIEDRNHRHGQTADMVNNIDLSATPLDRAMLRAQERKESIFQAVFKNIRALRLP
jgi:hypothetical protein